jgi:hypothetical protein
VKQKCIRVVWGGGNAEPTQRSEGGSSGGMEIVEALTEIVKVLRFEEGYGDGVQGDCQCH